MPYSKIMIHFIWATKKRRPIITKELKPLLLNHIQENSIKKEIHIERMNCVEDHIHLLVSLSREQTVAKVAMLIKGESSFWVNKEKLTEGKFEWQDEYIALSVSESGIANLRRYIDNQEEHHRKKNFEEEYNEYLEVHGLGDFRLAKADR